MVESRDVQRVEKVDDARYDGDPYAARAAKAAPARQRQYAPAVMVIEAQQAAGAHRKQAVGAAAAACAEARHERSGRLYRGGGACGVGRGHVVGVAFFTLRRGANHQRVMAATGEPVLLSGNIRPGV